MELGAEHVPAADHERYDHAKLAVARGLCDGCDGLIVTLKDWVKIRDILVKGKHEAWPCPILVPLLAIGVVEGEAALRQTILQTVAAGMPSRRGDGSNVGAAR